MERTVVLLEGKDVQRVFLGLLDWAAKMWGTEGSPLPSDVFENTPEDGNCCSGGWEPCLPKDAPRYRAAVRAMYQALETDDPAWEPAISTPDSGYSMPGFAWRGSWTSGRVVQFHPMLTGEVVLSVRTGTGEPSRFLGRCPAVSEFFPDLTRDDPVEGDVVR